MPVCWPSRTQHIGSLRPVESILELVKTIAPTGRHRKGLFTQLSDDAVIINETKLGREEKNKGPDECPGL
jgi:hypothetical protein